MKQHQNKLHALLGDVLVLKAILCLEMLEIQRWEHFRADIIVSVEVDPEPMPSLTLDVKCEHIQNEMPVHHRYHTPDSK